MITEILFCLHELEELIAAAKSVTRWDWRSILYDGANGDAPYILEDIERLEKAIGERHRRS